MQNKSDSFRTKKSRLNVDEKNTFQLKEINYFWSMILTKETKKIG